MQLSLVRRADDGALWAQQTLCYYLQELAPPMRSDAELEV